MSHSTLLRPHGLQPARFLCPRDFPGKNSGAGCISLSRGSSRPMDQTSPILQVDSLSLSYQGSPGIRLHARVCVCAHMLSHSVMSDSLRAFGLYPTMLLCPWNFSGKDTGLEQVVRSFSRGSSRPRDRTHVSCVSCIAGRFLTH